MTYQRLLCAIAIAAGACTVQAQNSTVLATGLNAPMKLAITPAGSLLVSEATVQPNTGRVSVVSRGGNRRTLIDGLPSGPAFPNNAPLGPAALVLDARTLYIGIQEGNSLVAGTPPTSHPVPNPNGPASPIFSSILKVTFSAEPDAVMSGFSLSLDQQFSLADGEHVTLTNSEGQTAMVEVLADFPDTPLDRREVYGHVTPYGMAMDSAKENLYIADAGQNRIIKVNASTGKWQTLVRFPRLTIPTGSGMTDPVPTSVRIYGDELLVSFLTGEPFAAGAAVVRIVNPTTREVRPFINGLRSATDVIVREGSGRAQFFVTEFRSILTGPPMTGQLIQYNTPEGTVVTNQLNGPTGMVQDPATGDIFVTEFLSGRISQIKPQ